MQSHEFKYSPLKNYDNACETSHRVYGDDDGDNDNDRIGGDDEVSHKWHIHWSLKLLFVIFLLTQVLYVMYESEYRYFSVNNATEVSQIHCNRSEGADNLKHTECSGYYDELKFVAIDEESTEEKSILKKSTPPENEYYETQQHPVNGSSNQEEEKVPHYIETLFSHNINNDTNNNNNNNNSLIKISEDKKNNYPTKATKTSATTTTTSSAFALNQKLSKLLKETFSSTTWNVINNESTTAAPASSPSADKTIIHGKARALLITLTQNSIYNCSP